MISFPDLLYVALFTIVLPLWDYLVLWPAFERRLETDPARARVWFWRLNIFFAWPLVAVGAALWMANDRSWSSFGFSVPNGWTLYASIGLVLLLLAYIVHSTVTVERNAEARESVRQQFSGKVGDVMPQTRAECTGLPVWH